MQQFLLLKLLYSDMTGPTSFAPIIETAIEIVDKRVGQYHVLMIIADGQVSRMTCISSSFYLNAAL